MVRTDAARRADACSACATSSSSCASVVWSAARATSRNGRNSPTVVILAGLSDVRPHDDAAAALDRLRREGARIVALTNSGAQQTEEILEQAELRGRFERVFSVSDVGAYKPDRRPYAHVVSELGVAPAEAALVAAHAWDIVGARAAGLESIWVDRLERRWPLPVPEPRRAASLADAVELLCRGS